MVGCSRHRRRRGAWRRRSDNAAHQQYAYEPCGNIDVETSGCHFERQLIDGQWRRVRVCG
jgi:hypothetical protein